LYLASRYLAQSINEFEKGIVAISILWRQLDLGVSVVNVVKDQFHREDAENTENAQRVLKLATTEKGRT